MRYNETQGRKGNGSVAMQKQPLHYHETQLHEDAHKHNTLHFGFVCPPFTCVKSRTKRLPCIRTVFGPQSLHTAGQRTAAAAELKETQESCSVVVDRRARHHPRAITVEVPHRLPRTFPDLNREKIMKQEYNVETACIHT